MHVLHRVAAVVVSVAVLAAIAPATAATAGESWNDYPISGAPEYAFAPFTFTVGVDGPEAVCGIEFHGVTVPAPPYSFTVSDPGSLAGFEQVNVSLCDGTRDRVRLVTTVPYRVTGTLLSADRSAGRQSIRVESSYPVPGTVRAMTRKGVVVASVAIPARSSVVLSLSRAQVASLGGGTVTVTADDGNAMSEPVVVAKGWVPLLDLADSPAEARIYPLCGNVTWNYDPTGANPKAKTIRKDIRRSLAILQAKAGITFTEVADPAKALLTYSWKDFGSSSPAATGGYSWSSNSPATGSVEINTRNYWPTDQYAGERPGRYGPAGRVWLLVHETMHTMGFGHVPDAASVMAPTNRGQAGFTRGDLAGFAALYPRAACR